jgi:hypothetical protein
MSVIELRVEGVDVTDSVVIAAASFTSQANGAPGECLFRIRDIAHEWSMTTGDEITLDVDGQRVWGGWIVQIRRGYFFDYENTSDCDRMVPRFLEIVGSDYNLLFSKRYVYDLDDPTNDELTSYTAGTADDVIIKGYMANHLNLVGDGISDALVEHVSTPSTDTSIQFQPGTVWGQFMQFVSSTTGAIWYIDPDKTLVYTDVDTPNAPFGISDAPGPGEIGCRELSVIFDGTKLANDAFVWGFGVGDNEAVASEVADATSIAAHGRWQVASPKQFIWKQATADTVASTYVYGSPQNKRGGKDDAVSVECTVFEPGIRVGHKVSFRADVYDFTDVIPVRRMEITFPTPTDVKFKLTLSHEIDQPWILLDIFPFGWQWPEWPPWPPLDFVPPEWPPFDPCAKTVTFPLELEVTFSLRTPSAGFSIWLDNGMGSVMPGYVPFRWEFVIAAIRIGSTMQSGMRALGNPGSDISLSVSGHTSDRTRYWYYGWQSWLGGAYAAGSVHAPYILSDTVWPGTAYVVSHGGSNIYHTLVIRFPNNSPRHAVTTNLSGGLTVGGAADPSEAADTDQFPFANRQFHRLAMTAYSDTDPLGTELVHVESIRFRSGYPGNESFNRSVSIGLGTSEFNEQPWYPTFRTGAQYGSVSGGIAILKQRSTVGASAGFAIGLDEGYPIVSDNFIHDGNGDVRDDNDFGWGFPTIAPNAGYQWDDVGFFKDVSGQTGSGGVFRLSTNGVTTATFTLADGPREVRGIISPPGAWDSSQGGPDPDPFDFHMDLTANDALHIEHVAGNLEYWVTSRGDDSPHVDVEGLVLPPYDSIQFKVIVSTTEGIRAKAWPFLANEPDLYGVEFHGSSTVAPTSIALQSLGGGTRTEFNGIALHTARWNPICVDEVPVGESTEDMPIGWVCENLARSGPPPVASDQTLNWFRTENRYQPGTITIWVDGLRLQPDQYDAFFWLGYVGIHTEVAVGGGDVFDPPKVVYACYESGYEGSGP